MRASGTGANYGILSSGKSEVDIRAQGTLSIESEAVNQDRADSVKSYGVLSSGNQSTVSLSGHDVSVSAHADNSSAYAVFANGGGKLFLTAEPGGRLVISASQGFAAPTRWDRSDSIGVVANDGGQATLTGSDILVTADIDYSEGLAHAVFSGWNNAVAHFKGYNGMSNNMEFSSRGDMAFTLFGTNSGTVNVTGGDQNDNVRVSATADTEMAVGVFGQAGGRVNLDGGAGQDTLTIDANFTGSPSGAGTVTDGGQGAYGIASAWGHASTTVEGFDEVNINANNYGTGGRAYGMYAQSNWNENSVNTIRNDGSLTLNINASAPNPEDAYAMYTLVKGENRIEGGSRSGDGQGDRLVLNGNVRAAGWQGGNSIRTGEGDDVVSIHGYMKADGNASWNRINTGDGNDTVNIYGYVESSNGSVSSIATGAGDDVIMTGGVLADNGTVTYAAGEGDDQVVINGDMDSRNTGAVNIDLGTGSDRVDIMGDVLASDMGYVDINSEGGVDQVLIGGTVRAEQGHVSITTGGEAGDSVQVGGG